MKMQFVLSGLVVLVNLYGIAWAQSETVHELKVFPPEHRAMTDPETGTELLFLTTHPGHDQNLYYEQRSWLADNSLILFNSGRDEGGLMGYLTATGELVRLTTPSGGIGAATAARSRNSVFGIRNDEIIELALKIEPSTDLAAHASRVTAQERIICRIGPNYMPANTSLSESCDGTYLAVGAGARASTDPNAYGYVLLIDIKTGDLREVKRVPGACFHGHVMFSLANPNYLFHAGGSEKTFLEVVDIRDGSTIWSHHHKEGEEFCTHHCWWINDSITFCGGFHLKPQEDFDVKVIDIHTRVIRIIGRGNWWPEGTPEELARLNWWHSSGHESGRWIAADNWHGDIGIFHGRTTRTYWLTKGHRTYGGGTHPEVGWDRRAEQVVFASHMLGNVDVCVATIPRQWQEDWENQ